MSQQELNFTLNGIRLDVTPMVKYTRPMIDRAGYWNTRQIKKFFEYLEENNDDNAIATFLNAMGWSYDQYKNNIQWTENLIRNYHQDREIAVLW